MTAAKVNARIRRYRSAMRMAGLRPAQIWTPEMRRTDFLRECRRQSRLANKADRADKDLWRFMDAAWADLANSDDWTPCI